MTTKQTEPKKRKRKIAVIVAAAAIAFALLAWLIVALVSRNVTENKTAEKQDSGDLAALHEFPPIEFADSLYYKKNIVSYENEQPRDVFYYEKDSLGQPTNVKVHETHYYPEEKVYIDGNIKNNERDGLWYAYHKNGNVQTMAHYRNGQPDGLYAVYHENGSVYYTGQYKAGKRVGVWKFYDEKEKLVRTENFDQK